MTLETIIEAMATGAVASVKVAEATKELNELAFKATICTAIEAWSREHGKDPVEIGKGIKQALKDHVRQDAAE